MNFKATVRVSRNSLSASIASPGSLAPDVMSTDRHRNKSPRLRIAKSGQPVACSA